MESRTLLLLEFPKVLALLAEHAVSDSGRQACESIQPLPAAEVAVHADVLEQGLWWAFEANYSLSPFPDLEPMLAALDNPAAVLDLDDLAALGLALDQARRAKESLDEFQAR
ncbi:MAG: endonuclease MutS2, partial [Desulfovibrionaceae bacterium]